MRLDQYQSINNKSIYDLRVNISLVMSDDCVDSTALDNVSTRVWICDTRSPMSLNRSLTKAAPH